MASDSPSRAISSRPARGLRSGSTTRPTYSTFAMPRLSRATARRTAGLEVSSLPPPGLRTTSTIAGLGS